MDNVEPILAKLRSIYPSASPDRQANIRLLAAKLKDPSTPPSQIVEVAKIARIDLTDPVLFRQFKCMELSQPKKKIEPPAKQETPDELLQFWKQLQD